MKTLFPCYFSSSSFIPIYSLSVSLSLSLSLLQDMSYNNLTKIPDELLKSKSLIVLDLSHNKVSTIPGAVSWHCLSTEFVYMHHFNEITKEPYM